MLRATVLVGHKIFVKIACIPFLTHLSETKSSGQRVGLALSEDIFVDADLDRLLNPYLDTRAVAPFLMLVLQKHLASELGSVGKLPLEDWCAFVVPNMFANAECLRELLYASAGIPRDFLRLFMKCVESTNVLPISDKAVREATHLYFRSEKAILLGDRPTEKALLAAVFH